MGIKYLFVFLENFFETLYYTMIHIFFKTTFAFFLAVILSCNSVYSADKLLVTEVIALNSDTTFRYSYLYNTTGNKVLETKYYSQNSNWIPKSQKEWVYMTNKCIGLIERTWANNDWKTDFTIDYNYENGLLIKEIQSKLENDAMTEYRKILYAYLGNVISQKNEFYLQNGTWELSVSTNNTLLENGKLGSSTTYAIKLGAFVSNYLSTFTYNSVGNLSSQLLQIKDDNSKWVNYEFTNWYYTATGSSLVSSLRSKKWDSKLQIWENTQRTDYEYNSEEQLITETNQRWKSMFWEMDTRSEYMYDGNGRQTNKKLLLPIYNEWRSIVSINYAHYELEKVNFIDSKFNFWGGITGELTASFIPYLFNDEVVIHKAKQISISYIKFVDTSIPTNYGTKSPNSIVIYPNPSDGIYYVDAQKYNINSWMIYDLKGLELKTQLKDPSTGIIDIANLPKGIYILKAITNNSILTQRLIKN